MDEAEECDRVGIMDHARLIALDTPAALKSELGGDVVRLRTEDNELAVAWLLAHERLEPVIENGFVRFEVENASDFVPALLTRIPVAVGSLDIAKPTLNDVFLRLTGHAIRDESAESKERLRSVL